MWSPAPPTTATRVTRASAGPATRIPPTAIGRTALRRCAKSRNVSGCVKEPTRPWPVPLTWSTSRGATSTRPHALAKASHTPGEATSALVCATYRAMSLTTSEVTAAPLALVVATLCTPRNSNGWWAVSYTHLRAHETDSYLVCRLLLEKQKHTRPYMKKHKIQY